MWRTFHARTYANHRPMSIKSRNEPKSRSFASCIDGHGHLSSTDGQPSFCGKRPGKILCPVWFRTVVRLTTPGVQNHTGEDSSSFCDSLSSTTKEHLPAVCKSAIPSTCRFIFHKCISQTNRFNPNCFSVRVLLVSAQKWWSGCSLSPSTALTQLLQCLLLLNLKLLGASSLMLLSTFGANV